MRRRIQVEAEKPQFCVTTGITFAQADAWFGNTVQDLKLDLIYPRDNTRKYPCVVWICGGAWIQMDRSAHLAYLSVLAQQGFVVASVEYRTSNEAKFPAPLQDVKAGIRYLRAHADRFNIDPDRIGVMGESAGGYLTCMAALATDPVYDVGENLEYSSAVQAACPWYPPTDFRGFPYSDPEQCAASPESLLMGKNVMRHPEEALACCPVSFVTKAAPPFLIIHGENDHTVRSDRERNCTTNWKKRDVTSHCFRSRMPTTQIFVSSRRKCGTKSVRSSAQNCKRSKSRVKVQEIFALFFDCLGESVVQHFLQDKVYPSEFFPCIMNTGKITM